MLKFRVIVILLFFASFVLAIESQTVFDARSYFPLGVGYYWNYIDSSAVVIDTTHTSIIFETVASGYTTYVGIKFSEGMTDSLLFQIRPDGIYAIKPEESLVLKLLPTTFSVGDSWFVFTMDTSWDSASMNFTHVLKVIGRIKGLEDVSVPAGMFRNCVRVLDSQYVHFTVRAGGVVVYDTMYTDAIMNFWLARNVGLVKSTDYDPSTGDYEYSYLISYSVSSVEENRVDLPRSNQVVGISPNPFNSSCRIRAPAESIVRIYDVRGRCIDIIRLNNGQAVWNPDGKNESGVYFFRFVFRNGLIITKKAVYLK